MYLCGLILLNMLWVWKVSAVSGTLTCNDVEGYYWRDYVGQIPSDAIPGAISAEGIITYIGQTLHSGLIVPGKIDSMDKKMYYEWGHKVYEGTENVKIFCTNHPEKLEWIPTTSTKFKYLSKRLFILGGNEPGNIIYIGRAYSGNELLLGKLQVRATDKNAILHSISNDPGKIEQYQFEVLTYNENTEIPFLSSRNKIDEKLREQCKHITVNFYN